MTKSEKKKSRTQTRKKEKYRRDGISNEQQSCKKFSVQKSLIFFLLLLLLEICQSSSESFWFNAASFIFSLSYFFSLSFLTHSFARFLHLQFLSFSIIYEIFCISPFFFILLKIFLPILLLGYVCMSFRF
jgi:uncharacterized membrane protein